MQLLEYLINAYEETENVTVDEFLSEVLKNDTRFTDLKKEEVVELKRQFLDYVRDSEERRDYEEPSERVDASTKDIHFDKLPEELVGSTASPRKRKRAHKKYVEAFVNNISVPKTLEELQEYFLNGNDAQSLIEDVNSTGRTCWTVPNWAKRGDIVLFMHTKTANSTLTKLRTQVRARYKPDSSKAKRFERSIADQLTFHKKYGGKIYTFGRVNGKPQKMEVDPLIHSKSNIFCDIDNLFLLDNPIDISEFNSFIMISRQGGITPIFGSAYERLKEIICEKNIVCLISWWGSIPGPTLLSTVRC